MEISQLTLVLRQSGALPYRIKAGKVEVLLVTSTRHKHWIVPKGWIALGLSAAESAAKEALEEAGVCGQVQTPRDRYLSRSQMGLSVPDGSFLAAR